MSTADSPVLVDSGVVEQQVREVLRAWGMRDDDADTAARAITDADLAGIDSHGVSMLPTYEQLHARGELQLTALPVVLRETAVSAVLDARGGLGHPTAVRAMTLAGDKALAHGLGAVSVRGSSHFGATGYYAGLAAARGLVALVTTTARTISVLPTRGAEPRLSTNPLAFAAPAGRHPPFLLDMSTSTAAINKIKVRGYVEEQLPVGWVVDPDGDPVTDPHEAMTVIRSPGRGGLTPLGATADLASHKGYGLGVMVQILSATLSGAGASSGGSSDIGHFFLALDPATFREDGGFESDVAELLDELHATAPTDPDLPVLVAGDPETRSRLERTAGGIPLPGLLVTQFRELCLRAGVPFFLTAP